MWLPLVAAAPLSAFLGGLAYQGAEAAGTGDLTTTVVTAIAGSSPFAALAIYVITSQRSDLKAERADKDSLIKDVIDRVIPAQVESNRLHGEVVEVLKAVTVQAHMLAGRQFDPQTLGEILTALRERRDGRT